MCSAATTLLEHSECMILHFIYVVFCVLSVLAEPLTEQMTIQSESSQPTSDGRSGISG